MKRARETKLLVVGKKPFNEKNKLGMGGVVVHVVRLTEWLDKQGLDYRFYDLSLFRLFSLIFHYAVLLVLLFHQIRSRFSGAIYIGVPSMCSVTVHSGSFSAPAETASERIILLIA